MPNRIIKESLCTSEKIAELTDFEFRLWVGLITQADDMGRGDARAAIIKGRVFPLRDRITAKDIDAAVHGLAAKGCVSLYTVGGKPYFWFPTWSEHQRVRDCKPKFPGPEESDENQQDLFFCGNSPQSAAGCGEMRPESNPNPNTNPNPNIPPCIPPQGEPAGQKPKAAKNRAVFVPPSVEEVAAYCHERQNHVDPQRFVDFYESKGWMVGRTKMKDWKAAVRTWEKPRDDGQGRQQETGRSTTYSRMNDVFAQVQRRNSGEY